MVDSFEDISVELEGVSGFVRHLQNLEGISKSLNTNTNRSVSHVGVSSLNNGVVVDVNNSVEIFCYALGHLVEVVEIKLKGFSVSELR